MRFFNTAGPIRPDDHYCIPPLERLDLAGVWTLIEQKKYFVLHTPRQTGKTSALLALRDLLNADGRYRCAYVNVEGGQAGREDTQRVMQTILGELALCAREALQDEFVEEIWFDALQRYGPDGALRQVLSRWAGADAKPLVLLIDEIDSLIGDSLLSVLRQLRAAMFCGRRVFRRVWCCAGCAMCAITAFIQPPSRRLSPAAARLTSRPHRYGWEIFRRWRCKPCWHSTPRRPAKRLRRRPWR